MLTEHIMECSICS